MSCIIDEKCTMMRLTASVSACCASLACPMKFTCYVTGQMDADVGSKSICNCSAASLKCCLLPALRMSHMNNTEYHCNMRILPMTYILSASCCSLCQTQHLMHSNAVNTVTVASMHLYERYARCICSKPRWVLCRGIWPTGQDGQKRERQRDITGPGQNIPHARLLPAIRRHWAAIPLPCTEDLLCV